MPLRRHPFTGTRPRPPGDPPSRRAPPPRCPGAAERRPSAAADPKAAPPAGPEADPATVPYPEEAVLFVGGTGPINIDDSL
ncbi:hypothetical protein GCM10023322_75090 [Rugosimonospora acidiphila]|uniref:Uncharacterized protein n=1 Tax=Rugosimonospora acidiphila TaxID=556531 RepID=A0ABP9SN21_9ACTN